MIQDFSPFAERRSRRHLPWSFKNEIRNTKHETNLNNKNINDKNLKPLHQSSLLYGLIRCYDQALFWFSRFKHLNIRILYLFRPALARLLSISSLSSIWVMQRQIQTFFVIQVWARAFRYSYFVFSMVSLSSPRVGRIFPAPPLQMVV